MSPGENRVWLGEDGGTHRGGHGNTGTVVSKDSGRELGRHGVWPGEERVCTGPSCAWAVQASHAAGSPLKVHWTWHLQLSEGSCRPSWRLWGRLVNGAMCFHTARHRGLF